MQKVERLSEVKALLIFVFGILFSNVFGQKILPENLGPKVKLYWDANNKRIHSVGCYYVDPINPQTTEKHGKWLFYAFDGTLEAERFYYRNRMHGKQTVYFPSKKIKQVYYSEFNVPDSSFKEYDEQGTLIIEGQYLLGSPEGVWHYFYPDSTLWKEERVSNDTTYLIKYVGAAPNHQLMVQNGDGQVDTYYSLGGLKESYTFKQGLRHGFFYEFLASGQPSITGCFEFGKKNGAWKFYFPDGTLEKEENYLKDSLDGRYMVYFENGNLQTEGSYNYGQKEGLWTWNKRDGGLEMKGNFINNLQDGAWEYYYSSGELSYTANFTKGLKSGKWNYYYKDGTQFKEGEYRLDKKEGPWQTWYEDGTLLMEGKYHEGLEIGEWKNYWPNGRIKNKSFYKSGLLNGAWYSFSPEGKLQLFGRYKKGNKTGKWTDFYNNGRKKEEVSYKVLNIKNKTQDVVSLGFKEKQSVKQGKYTAYSQVDFTAKELGKYKKGKKHGKWINYYPGGVVPAVITNYKNGLLHGTFNQYDRRGNKMNEIQYKNGLKDGWFIVYGTNGKPISQKMFRKGHELSRKAPNAPFSPE